MDNNWETLMYEWSWSRLDKRLSEQLPYSRNFFEHIIQAQRLYVTTSQWQHITPKKSYKLKSGNQVHIQSLERFDNGGILEEAAYLDIVDQQVTNKATHPYIHLMIEKDDYMIIYKPKWVLSHPNSIWDLQTPSVVASVFQYIKQSSNWWVLPSTGNFIRAGLIHRLDKATDGLMILVKTEAWLQYFKALFQQKSLASTIVEKENVPLKKYYTAICDSSSKGTAFLEYIQNQLPYIIQENVVPKVPYPTIKEGITKILAIDTSAMWPWKVKLDIEILTWRTHQIRYHLSTHWLPIVGDYLYNDTCWEDTTMFLTAKRLVFKDIYDDMIDVSV